MNFDTTRARLERLVAADTDPALTVDELDDLMAVARRVDTAGNHPANTSTTPLWAASTSVTAGTVVRVASTPARYWRARQSGVTAATAPVWPDLSRRTVTGVEVWDGSVVWSDNGAEWSPTWNLEAAAADGWRTKAAKAAGRFDFGEDGQQFSRSQVVAHCTAMAKRFEGRNAGSTRTPSSV